MTSNPRNCWSCGQPMEFHDHVAKWWCHSPKCQCYRYTLKEAFLERPKEKKPCESSSS